MIRSTLVAFFCLPFGTAGQSSGATLTNHDADPFMLIVTEDGTQVEMGVRQGESLEFCLEGCFVVLPNGNRAALTGDEIIEISGGRANFK